MQARTWLQKLTDESSVWFNAVKAEDDGDNLSAASFYLNDAQLSAKNNSLVRQALSISCAANCMARIGAAVESKQLYSEAAKLYLKNAESVISESIREALWSLEEAFENLILANDRNGARKVRAQYLALAARKSPFSTSAEAIRELDGREKSCSSDTTPMVKAVELPPKLRDEIRNALKSTQQRDVVVKEAAFSPAALAHSMVLDGGSKIDEKGIVS